MSKKFDADAYVSRWDDKLIPIMLVVIVALMVAVYAMNVALRPACTTHDYVFCGTDLDQPSSVEHEAGAAHPGAEGNHAPAGEGHAPAGHGESSEGHGHPH